MRMKFIIMVLLFFMVVASWLTVAGQHNPASKWCSYCGMNLKMFGQTNYRLTLGDGTIIRTCSIHCAAIAYQREGEKVVRVEAADYTTKAFMEAEVGHYLVGSDLPGTMTAVSKLVFFSVETARKYQQEHGGIIVSFQEALQRAFEDQEADLKLIEKRVAKRVKIGKALAEKLGCMRCHSPEGGEDMGPAWDTPDFAKKVDSRIKIKEAILKGRGKMHAFEGKINEKDLHCLALYIWSSRPPVR